MHDATNDVDPDRCWFCGAYKELVDARRTPRIRGGGNEPENRVQACRKCSTLKGVMNVDEFREVVRSILITAGRHSPHATFDFRGEGGPAYRYPRPPPLKRGRPPKPERIPRTPARHSAMEVPCRHCGEWMDVRYLAEVHQPMCAKAQK